MTFLFNVCTLLVFFFHIYVTKFGRNFVSAIFFQTKTNCCQALVAYLHNSYLLVSKFMYLLFIFVHCSYLRRQNMTTEKKPCFSIQCRELFYNLQYGDLYCNLQNRDLYCNLQHYDLYCNLQHQDLYYTLQYHDLYYNLQHPDLYCNLQYPDLQCNLQHPDLYYNLQHRNLYCKLQFRHLL